MFLNVFRATVIKLSTLTLSQSSTRSKISWECPRSKVTRYCISNGYHIHKLVTIMLQIWVVLLLVLFLISMGSHTHYNCQKAYNWRQTSQQAGACVANLARIQATNKYTGIWLFVWRFILRHTSHDMWGWGEVYNIQSSHSKKTRLFSVNFYAFLLDYHFWQDGWNETLA
jgi:hypothetical protein